MRCKNKTMREFLQIAKTYLLINSTATVNEIVEFMNTNKNVYSETIRNQSLSMYHTCIKGAKQKNENIFIRLGYDSKKRPVYTINEELR